MSLRISSEAFANDERIPAKHSKDGRNLSPPLQFDGVPERAQELVLIADDPDAPRPEPWVHWVMYGIPAGVKRLPEGIDASVHPSVPAGATQGPNSSGQVGYDGPAPPKGHGVHHYHFRLYALDGAMNLRPGAGKKALLDAMRDHVVDQAELTGTYER